MAGEMVVIACKAPNGLILNLDRYELVHSDKPDVRRIPGKMAPVTLRGWSVPRGVPNHTLESGGYGLTQVPADFWEAWYALNKDSDLIADKIILPPTKQAADGARQARDFGQVPQMFHQAQQKGDPRLPAMERNALAPDDSKAA